MEFTYREVDVLGADREQYKYIHKSLFKTADIDDKWINWYHRDIVECDTRLSQSRTYGLFDHNKLIGIWSVEPKILKLDSGELIKVGRCFAVGVSEDYRRMGLFVSLSKFAIESERDKGEFEYILGFPQTGRSVIGGHLKAGWSEVSNVDIYSHDMANITHECTKSDLNSIITFSTISTDSSKAIMSFDEQSDYRDVRYKKHPRLHYLTYSYKDAYIVIKSYSNFYHILDIRGSKENTLFLLKAILSIAKRHGIAELNIWCNEKYEFKDVLVEANFKNGATHGLPITIIAVQINANKPLVIGGFNFGMGVEEGY